jgi:hypothetical protein
MDTVRVVQEDFGVGLGDRVAVADSWWRRLRGLLGRPELAPEEGTPSTSPSSMPGAG